jgi:hypothetical protein
MPEQALPGTVTNTGQPQAVVGSPASELETSMSGTVTLPANVTVTGTPAAE